MTFSLPRERSPRWKYLIYLVVLSLLAIAAWYFTRPAPLSVQLARVERGLVEATVSNTRAGTVKACRRAKLAAPAGGQISSLLVKKGQRVKAGQVLLELWNEDLQAQLQLAEQQLKTVTSRIDEVCTIAEQSSKAAEDVVHTGRSAGPTAPNNRRTALPSSASMLCRALPTG